LGRVLRRYAYNGLFIATIFAGFLAVTILYAAREVQSGHMTVGTFVLVNTYMLQIVRPVEQLGYAMQMLSQGLAFLGKLFEIFREQPEVAAGVEHSAPGGAGRLEFAQVAVAYRADRVILTDINFTLPAGKYTGGRRGQRVRQVDARQIAGETDRSGCGPNRARWSACSELSLGWLRQAIAVVPQDTVLFQRYHRLQHSVRQGGSTQAEVEHVARLAHLHDFIMSLPDGYDTKVGERGVNCQAERSSECQSRVRDKASPHLRV